MFLQVSIHPQRGCVLRLALGRSCGQGVCGQGVWTGGVDGGREVWTGDMTVTECILVLMCSWGITLLPKTLNQIFFKCCAVENICLVVLDILYFRYQAMWSVKTPFDEYRIGKWELNYSFRPGTLRADTKFDYNGKVMAVNLNGATDLPNHMVDGSITVNTPFRGTSKQSSKGTNSKGVTEIRNWHLLFFVYLRETLELETKGFHFVTLGYEAMTASLKHNDDGKTFASELKTRINPRMYYTLAFNMNHAKQGWAITNNGDLSFTCPRGYEYHFPK